MSAIVPVASVSAVAAAPARPQSERPTVQIVTPSAAPMPAKRVEPIRYYGGIDGMNATNLIVALQANGTASSSYSTRVSHASAPPPAIVDRGA